MLTVGLLALGCLPGDERPEPGELFVAAEPSAATKDGFTTSDGWTIVFDRVLMTVGHVFLEEDSNSEFTGSSGPPCNMYTRGGYNRLFDFPAIDREKVAVVFGLGTCAVSFGLFPPSEDTLLGPGVRSVDVTYMQERSASDDYDDAVIAIVRGRSTDGQVEKRFNWSFAGAHSARECLTTGSLGGGSGDEPPGVVSIVELHGGQSSSLTLEARAEELFRVAPHDDEPLHFDRFAEADADSDGVITLDELDEVDAPTPTIEGAGIAGGTGTGGSSTIAPPNDSEISLLDLVKYGLVPKMVRIKGGGPCLTDGPYGNQDE